MNGRDAADALVAETIRQNGGLDPSDYGPENPMPDSRLQRIREGVKPLLRFEFTDVSVSFRRKEFAFVIVVIVPWRTEKLSVRCYMTQELYASAGDACADHVIRCGADELNFAVYGESYIGRPMLNARQA